MIRRPPISALFPYRTLFRSGVSAAVVGGRRNVKGPGGASFDRFVGVAASNHRDAGVDHSHLLAALSAITAKVGRLPDAGRVKRRPAISRTVCYNAVNCVSVS